MIEDILAIYPKEAKAFCDNVEQIDKQARVGFVSNQQGSVQVLSIMGGIRHRGFGFSIESFREKFNASVRDDRVKAIVLNVDSPGGTVSGVPEMAAEIFAARSVKPIIAVANTFAASAAYWLASAASELVVTPSGSVGSIGVFAMHIDQSKMIEEMGIGITIISAGENKTEGNPFEPLSERANAEIQRDVDEINNNFVSAVARHRGTTPNRVNKNFGQGRMISANNAVEIGMADRVATIDQVVSGLVNNRKSRRMANFARRAAIV